MPVKWDKVGAIAGVFAIPIAIFAIFVQVTTPEIRCRIGLDEGGCYPKESSSPTLIPSNSSQSSPAIPNLDPSPYIPTPSEVNANYSQLQDFLALKKFEEAHQETRRLLLWIARRKEGDDFSREDFEAFPCTDLRTIDQLWMRWSNGRFGFSVQNRIWQEIGRDPAKFFNRVGWQSKDGYYFTYKNLTFELRAPLGGLPATPYLFHGLPGNGPNSFENFSGVSNIDNNVRINIISSLESKKRKV